MDVQNAANGHLASLRVTEGVFPNDLNPPKARYAHFQAASYKRRLTNVLIALCLIRPARASTTYRVSGGRGVVGT